MNWQNPPPKQKRKKKPKLGKSHEISETTCPECGLKLDSAACLSGDRKPKPGNLTLCIKCSHALIIGKDLKLREMNDKEIVAWAGRPELIKATQILTQVRIKKAIHDVINDINKNKQHD